MEHFRTENAEIHGSESEPGATLDTKSENPGFRVRTEFTFLQNELSATGDEYRIEVGQVKRTNDTRKGKR